MDNKAFTGQHITINGRATFVLIKEDAWKIIHYHLDKISNLVFIYYFSALGDSDFGLQNFLYNS